MRTSRRALLAATGGALAATAGCLGSLPGSSGGSKPSCDVGEQQTVQQLPRPALGPDDASVTVDAYEDFACPHCATYSTEVFPKIREDYISSGDIRYRFFDFPLPVNEQWSWGGAIAARAVQDRTDAETFFDYAHAIFENQDKLTSSGYQLVHDLAEDRSVNGCQVMAAVEQDTYRPVVEADRQRAVDKGYSSTPTVVVDGQALDSYGYDAVSSAIDSKL
ncbi:thioredoxin domain-containing protein [Halopelagius fulvigenes]|uniref:Thioredoxin domain-containing protein n=1 Tax=Halopelagius fulvigenes TaxID=1198324 RepID=A0ABD5U2E4_9EURY